MGWADAVKLRLLQKATYNNFSKVDKETEQFISSANLQNYLEGKSFGLNSISGDLVGGVTNRHASFKDRMFFEENGFYADPTFARIA